MTFIGTEASLGANTPDYSSYPLPLVFGIEVLATALLMAVIYLVVHTKGLRGLGGLVIGGMVGLDIFFLAFISGASMNPARSLGASSPLWRPCQSVALLDCYFHWKFCCSISRS